MSVPPAAAEPTGFFVLRTPLYPIDELRDWSRGCADCGDDHARTVLRERLRALLERPELAEAIYVASPAFHAALDEWRANPLGRRGRKVERSLVRYVTRAGSRPTPFGLFAGYAVGRVGAETSLRLPPCAAYRRHTRLDMSYLSAVAEAAEAAPGFRSEARYRPNRTMYRAAGRLHYVERANADGERRLVAVAETPPLAAILDRAAGGARQDELAQALAERGAPAERAREYVRNLIDARALEPGIDPPVTGVPALHALIAALERQESTTRPAAVLRDAQARLSDLDRDALGVAPERYESIAAGLERLAVPIQPGNLFQVDLAKPAPELGLSGEIVEELLRGVERLRLLHSARQDPLEALRTRFRDRYETRTVPMLEAFDDEAGIGLEALPEPALGEDAIGTAGAPPPWQPRDTLLLDKLMNAARAGGPEIVLQDAELQAIAPAELPELPGAFAAMATLAGEPGSPQLVFLHGAFGPSGARMLARFCDADPALRRLVEQHLRDEESLEPDAVFAEVAHLPTTRLGNVVRRPLLREYEIDYLGPSGAPEERRIPVSDLLVTLDGDRLVLRSERLGRRVVPRVSSAVATSLPLPPLFRLLGMLQNQGASGLSFDWGALREAASLPRVRAGRTVLALARWRIAAADVPSPHALRRLRRERGLPRFIAVHERGNPLTVDLDNQLCVDGLLAILDRRGAILAFEIPGVDDGLCVEGPEGRFVHELLVPFTRRRAAGERAAPVRRLPAAIPFVARRFPPGSDWLYAKLYGGPAAVERTLCETLAPLCARLADREAIDGWHFLRYSDPDHHLRLRMHGDPAALQEVALPELQRAAGAEIEQGRLWRLAFDTYDREIERYGGPAAIDTVESVFAADSTAVVELLAETQQAEARLDLALLGVDALLDELGLASQEKRATVSGLAAGLRARLGPAAPAPRELGIELRACRSRLEEARHEVREGRPPALAGALRKRATALAPPARRLAELEAAGELATPLSEIAKSLAHMHVNRVLREPQPEDELRIYDRLDRLHRSEAARAS